MWILGKKWPPSYNTWRLSPEGETWGAASSGQTAQGGWLPPCGRCPCHPRRTPACVGFELRRVRPVPSQVYVRPPTGHHGPHAERLILLTFLDGVILVVLRNARGRVQDVVLTVEFRKEFLALLLTFARNISVAQDEKLQGARIIVEPACLTDKLRRVEVGNLDGNDPFSEIGSEGNLQGDRFTDSRFSPKTLSVSVEKSPKGNFVENLLDGFLDVRFRSTLHT